MFIFFVRVDEFDFSRTSFPVVGGLTATLHTLAYIIKGDTTDDDSSTIIDLHSFINNAVERGVSNVRSRGISFDGYGILADIWKME